MEVEGLLKNLHLVWNPREEDTPAVALRRHAIVEDLKETLKRKTRKCQNIRGQPHNALARFLFSGITEVGGDRADPYCVCACQEPRVGCMHDEYTCTVSIPASTHTCLCCVRHG